MIAANELRIGNWVEMMGGQMCLSERIFYLLLMDKIEGDGERLKVIEPIPLTPEILEKAGFEDEGLYYSLDNFKWYKHGLFLEYDSTVTGGYSLDISHIEHLHQLQNLYQALTGQELEINLQQMATT